MTQKPPIAPADIAWTETGAPRAAAYDDVYFSERDGRAETEHVFLAGNGLPERWRGPDVFTIGELGFGVGLNFCATWATWAAWTEGQPEATPTLHYVSFELHPPRAEDIRRALAPWPDLAARAETFLSSAIWPPDPGWRRLRLSETPRLELSLAIGDARAMITRWPEALPKADAWHLDGFSPAKNPELWEAGLLKSVAACTAPGGTAATYSAAGWVRRNLDAAGFETKKIPGPLGKRDMTTAALPSCGLAQT
ncbi:MAG: tRNA (5-methylaminomethyl-2-thiouridine)(34)-methyltransferase MnmD [Rhodobacteraceae bacterium]|nr:tRNA (5-methylaminomethyl-2-thiouridine)(34)-methyltransferase MnmD [Paracoccaceae bacterium]